MERKLTGIPASPGIAVGPIRLLRWEIPDVKHRIVTDEEVPAELARLHDAVHRAKARLVQIQKRVEQTAGAEESQIFDVQCSILEDASLIHAIAPWRLAANAISKMSRIAVVASWNVLRTGDATVAGAPGELICKGTESMWMAACVLVEISGAVSTA